MPHGVGPGTWMSNKRRLPRSRSPPHRHHPPLKMNMLTNFASWMRTADLTSRLSPSSHPTTSVCVWSRGREMTHLPPRTSPPTPQREPSRVPVNLGIQDHVLPVASMGWIGLRGSAIVNATKRATGASAKAARMKIKRPSSPIAATTAPQLEEVLALPNARLVEVPVDGPSRRPKWTVLPVRYTVLTTTMTRLSPTRPLAVVPTWPYTWA
ncbi:hypothetical protein DFH08DRAFT_903675 [Mycena albidolilacea]|uniref:Uncharacterized protein n=1 Tax=Mycena albidolilacea TaxID=1033008 RepID=A0AAD7E8Z2_9AGAR|nr:hypothetical protein DFH08DRAFT_903675 [Mycena albidolilacea]